jgi:hypothetical protein
MMDAVYESCRWLNQYLGIVGCICVLWRLIPLLLERGHWTNQLLRHRILLFAVLAGYEIFAAVAASRAVGLDLVPAAWTSLAFTVLHVSTILLCVWWPHPPQPQVVPDRF